MIDERAMVHKDAKIAEGVTVGPWTSIGSDVEIGPGCEIGAHVIIKGPTKMGENNVVHSFASLGGPPQDKRYQGEPTTLEIGNNNEIREYCSLNRGTVQGNQATRLGDDNLLMANVHVAHDCIVGNNVVIANNTAMAGHVTIKDHAILSGFTAIHQFCHIGEFSFISGGSLVVKDIPPYLLVVPSKRRAIAVGINSEGLKRNGFSLAAITQLQRAFRVIYRKGLPLKEAISQLQTMAETTPEVGLMAEFLLNSERGIVA